MRRMALTGAALCLSLPAMAQEPAKSVSTAAPSPVAEHIAARLLPNGTYRTMMKSVMDQVMGSVARQMLDLPIRDSIKMAGFGGTDLTKVGDASLRQVMAIVDPAFEQRSQITFKVMAEEMTTLMSDLEPEYRAGLAEALTARFNGRQLDELDRFFATPTGSAYAGQSMLLYADPAMMRRMQALMPRIMAAMPAIAEKVKIATADLPKPRDAKSLPDEDRKKLEALLAPATDKQP